MPAVPSPKDGPHLFETVHLKAIRLVHQDQGGGIRHCPLFRITTNNSETLRQIILKATHKRASANAKLALFPDYQEVKNEFIAQSDGAGSGSEVRSAKYRIEELR